MSKIVLFCRPKSQVFAIRERRTKTCKLLTHRNINAQIGDTHILSNQLGYTSQREHLSNGFNPSAMIEVNC